MVKVAGKLLSSHWTWLKLSMRHFLRQEKDVLVPMNVVAQICQRAELLQTPDTTKNIPGS